MKHGMRINLGLVRVRRPVVAVADCIERAQTRQVSGTRLPVD